MKNKLIILLLFLATAAVIANDPERGFDPRDAGDLSDLLKHSEVRKELEIVDEQIRALEGGTSVAVKLLKDFEAERPRLTPTEEQKRSEEVLLEIRKAHFKAQQEALLPHQVDRLEQLRWQFQTLMNPVETYDRAVKLTDEQKKEMKAKAAELRQQLVDTMWQVHLRSQAELMEIMTEEQQAQWKGMTGNQFKFNPNSTMSPMRTFRF